MTLSNFKSVAVIALIFAFSTDQDAQAGIFPKDQMNRLLSKITRPFTSKLDRGAPPEISVLNLFQEIIVDPEFIDGWEAVGPGLGQLTYWPMKNNRNLRLLKLHQNKDSIKIERINDKPMRIDSKSETFFKGIPTDRIPFDGTWVGLKYVFYPHMILDQANDELGEPIELFLVKKESTPTDSFSEFQWDQDSLNLTEMYYAAGLARRNRGNSAKQARALIWPALRGIPSPSDP